MDIYWLRYGKSLGSDILKIGEGISREQPLLGSIVFHRTNARSNISGHSHLSYPVKHAYIAPHHPIRDPYLLSSRTPAVAPLSHTRHCRDSRSPSLPLHRAAATLDRGRRTRRHASRSTGAPPRPVTPAAPLATTTVVFSRCPDQLRMTSRQATKY
uniref:Uncharacterized protein n=1 Tax=Oryza punctata TaxID=4537 RepID=A0A0E0K8T4_ORYPU